MWIKLVDNRSVGVKVVTTIIMQLLVRIMAANVAVKDASMFYFKKQLLLHRKIHVYHSRRKLNSTGLLSSSQSF